jgi:hypothetical protein
MTKQELQKDYKRYHSFMLIWVVIISYTLITSKCSAQDFEQDKFNHFVAGYTIGFAANGLTYSLLKNSKIELKKVKVISFVSGIIFSSITGYAKEKIDKETYGVPSNMDYQYTVMGGCLGTTTVRIIIGKSIPEKRYKKLKSWQEI